MELHVFGKHRQLHLTTSAHRPTTTPALLGSAAVTRQAHRDGKMP